MQQIQYVELQKSPLPQGVEVPSDCTMLHVSQVPNRIVVSMLGSLEAVRVMRKFIVVRASVRLADDFDKRWKFLGTAIFADARGGIELFVFTDAEEPKLVLEA
jgi:hypothetical protein